MKFDKDIMIAVVICGIVLFGWQPLAKHMGWIPEETAKTQAVTAPAEAPAPAVPSVPSAIQTVKTAPPEAVNSVPDVLISNDKLIMTVQPATGSVKSITLKDYLTADRKKDIVIDQMTSNAVCGALGVYSKQEKWDAKTVSANSDKQSLVLVRQIVTGTGNTFNLIQKISLGDGYVTKEEITFVNHSEKTLTLPQVVVSGGEIQQWQPLSGDKVRSDAMKFDFCTADGKFTDIAGDAKESKFFRSGVNNVSWVALSNKYFISILKGERPFELAQGRVFQNERYIVNSGAAYQNITVPAKSSVSFRFELYSGPKIADRLEAFAPAAERTMHLAWGPLDYLARFLLWSLVKLHNVCGSYGWSIIILTVIVRLLFWPITARANASIKRMSAVQPKIQELRAKYKDNPQMLNAKMMELYREEKINPLGGCLPILLQIPVFFALYATLDSAVELRQVPFWWAKDLAAADTVAVLFGVLPLNPLVIAMTLLMVLQQRLTPTAMEPMQQKMMLAMPVVMLFFLYDLPSGLTLYWTVSQIFSIIQLLVQQKVNKKTVQPAKAV